MLKCDVARTAPRIAAAWLSVAALVSVQAVAQDAGAGGAAGAATDQTAATSDTGELAEVVVTAEKRTENLQTLPQTVTAVTGTQLLQQGIKDITDISRVAPEVTVTTGQLNNVGIRGVRTGSFGPTLDSANAVYVDGAYNARFTSLNGLFFDMARVEVLDGPQGTLYGRNSAGGAMNIITNKPTQNFGGYGWVEVGTYDDLTLNGALNLPLTDSLAFRMAYMRNSHSGFDSDSGLDDQGLQGGRGELLWKPTSSDSLLLTAQESKVNQKGQGATTIVNVFKNPTITTDTTAGAVLQYNGACPAGHACTTQVVPINATNDPRHNAVLEGEANLWHSGTLNDAFALQFDHTFGSFADLTFQASRMSTLSNNSSGNTAGLQQNPLLIAAGLFETSSGADPFTATDYVKDQWDSEELRLTSISTRPLQWVVGLYRYHEIGGGSNSTFNTSAISTPGPTAGGLVFPAGSPTIATDIPNVLNNDNARAVFGQATWTPGFLSSLHVTGGLRYNDEGKHGIVYIYPQHGPLSVGAFGPTGLFDASKTWSATTYKANISYDLTPNHMVYIDRSTGFQSGGFGYGGSPAYEPTHIWAWEIGSKNRFFDNRLQANLSAWYYNYSDQTANISDVFLVSFGGPPFPFNFITVANAGTSIDRGQSLDVQWDITRDDQFGLNVQHINEVYTNFNLTQRYLTMAAKFGVPFSVLYPGYSATGNQSGPSFNYNGTRVGSTPEWTVYSTYDHTFRWNQRAITAQVVYRFTGDEVTGNQEQPNMPPYSGFFMLPGYSTWDLSLSYQPEDGRYTITLFSRNLFNKLYATNRGYVNNGAALTPAASLYAYETESFGPPRVYGVQVQANF